MPARYHCYQCNLDFFQPRKVSVSELLVLLEFQEKEELSLWFELWISIFFVCFVSLPAITCVLSNTHCHMYLMGKGYSYIWKLCAFDRLLITRTGLSYLKWKTTRWQERGNTKKINGFLKPRSGSSCNSRILPVAIIVWAECKLSSNHKK